MEYQKEHTQKDHKKKRRGHISPKHKEPVAAISAGILLAVLLIVFSIGVFMIRDFVNFSTTPSPVKSSKSIVKAEKTEPKKLEATILSSKTSQGNEFYKPEANSQFYILYVDVVHHLGEPVWLAPYLESYMTDSTGKKYLISPSGVDKPFDAREYKIGEHGKGELSYQIPKTAKDLKWCYEFSTPNIKSCTDL